MAMTFILALLTDLWVVLGAADVNTPFPLRFWGCLRSRNY